MITALEQQLPIERENTVVTVEFEKLKAVCEQLESLLIDDNVEACDVLETHAELLNAAFPDEYPILSASILSFDFDAALITLRAATIRHRPINIH